MKQVIYLVGQISCNEPETYRWRERVRKELSIHENFEVIDPCMNRFNQEILKAAMDRKEVYNVTGIEVIPPKDFSYVDRSNICIANMNHYDKKKAFIGTLFELSRYYSNPEKSVIGIFNGDRNIDMLCKHPFVKSSIDIWVKDELEAVDMVRYYFEELK